jgi:menaquinol-cytochrome c reductase iron-sulfur subunit
MSEPSEPAVRVPSGSRRRFFQWVTNVAAGVIGMGLAIPLLGYLISPAFKRRTELWVDVASADALVLGEPIQLDYLAAIKDGWMETKIHKAIWAVKQGDEQLTVFSPMCTHLGCGYRWEASDRTFKCPCHGSVYDIGGKVIAGPAPRSLDVLPAKLENGRVLVIYKEFKAGLSTSREL